MCYYGNRRPSNTEPSIRQSPVQQPRFHVGKNFKVTFGIFSVLVTQINVLESYLDIYLF